VQLSTVLFCDANKLSQLSQLLHVSIIYICGEYKSKYRSNVLLEPSTYSAHFNLSAVSVTKPSLPTYKTKLANVQSVLFKLFLVKPQSH